MPPDVIWHIIETLGSTAAVALIAYGRISTTMKDFSLRLDSADKARETMNKRIDDIFTTLISKR